MDRLGKVYGSHSNSPHKWSAKSIMIVSWAYYVPHSQKLSSIHRIRDPTGTKKFACVPSLPLRQPYHASITIAQPIQILASPLTCACALFVVFSKPEGLV